MNKNLRETVLKVKEDGRARKVFSSYTVFTSEGVRVRHYQSVIGGVTEDGRPCVGMITSQSDVNALNTVWEACGVSKRIHWSPSRETWYS